MNNKQRVLVLMHPDLIPPESNEGFSEQDASNWKTEYDVVSTLRTAGYDVKPLGVHDELRPIRDEIEGWKPDVVFPLLEQFHGEAIYDQTVASYLELMRVPYTGCNPRGLMLARQGPVEDAVHYHRIPVPSFAVFPIGRKVKRPRRLAMPLIVKSVSEDASWGISQSVVDSDEKLAERVVFIHERIGTAAIAEQHIPGRRFTSGCSATSAARCRCGAESPSSPRAPGRSRPRRSSTTPTTRSARGILHVRHRTSRPRSIRASTPWRSASTVHARARRLRPHRFPAVRERHSLFHRGEPNLRSPRARIRHRRKHDGIPYDDLCSAFSRSA
jgi:hypothetical protein